MKTCTKCGAAKPLSEFSRLLSGKFCSHCKKCNAAYVKEWRIRNPGSHKVWSLLNPQRRAAINRKKNLKNKYGLTPDGFERMLAAQQGRCANMGCSSALRGDRKTHIDHVPGSSPARVRGLLCGTCNVAIGMAHESPRVLRGLASYLESAEIPFP